MHDEAAMLEAAARAILKRGYSGLRYSDVSEESGVPVPSLQHRFLTLDRLRRAALCRKVRLELDEHVQSLAHLTDPWAWVLAMIERTIAGEPAQREAEWRLWIQYQHAACYDPELAADYDELELLWLSAVHEVIVRGTMQGRFRPVMSTWDAARALQGMIDGLGAPLALPKPDSFVRELVRMLNDCAAQLLHPQEIAEPCAGSVDSTAHALTQI